MKHSGARSYVFLAHRALLGAGLALLAIGGCSDPDLDRARADEPDISDAGPTDAGGGIGFFGDASGCFPGVEGYDVGCACGQEGEEHECRRYYRLADADYTSCLIGIQTCTDGEWGECAGQRTIVVPPDELPPGITIGDTAPE